MPLLINTVRWITNRLERLERCLATQRQPVTSHDLAKIGDRVRIVELGGCMATERRNIRDGIMTSVTMIQAYGDSVERPYAVIRLDDGSTTNKVLAVNYWFIGDDGIAEYRN